MIFRRMWWLLSLTLLTASVPSMAQNGVDFPPVPANPYEIVTGGAQILMTPAQRAQGINLLTLAGQNYTFGQVGGPQTTLAVELQSWGSAKYEGEGSWQETWVPGRRSWSSSFAGVSNSLLDDVQRNPVPMRVQMSRMAVLWPVDRVPSLKQIRVAQANWEGKPVTCALVTEGRVAADASARGWREAEYCMDAGGLLQLMSPAPGVYFVYDNSAPLTYAGHTIAANISVVENENKVLQIHVTRLDAPSPAELDAVAQSRPAPGILLGANINFHPRVPPGTDYHVDNVVVVHATLSPQGKLLEYELPGGNSELGEAAVQRLQGLTLARRRNAQLELYARVESSGGQ
jgi:hypothetical protein